MENTRQSWRLEKDESFEKDYYPDEIVSVLVSTAGWKLNSDEEKDLTDRMLFVQAAAENHMNSDTWRGLYRLLEAVVRRAEQNGPEIVVEVSGGLVQNIYADGPASVEVYDFDDEETNGDEFEALIHGGDWRKVW